MRSSLGSFSRPVVLNCHYHISAKVPAMKGCPSVDKLSTGSVGTRVPACAAAVAVQDPGFQFMRTLSQQELASPSHAGPLHGFLLKLSIWMKMLRVLKSESKSNYTNGPFLNISLDNFLSIPRWLSGKESACQCRRRGFDPWVGKIPWSRKCQPTPALLPGESHGQRSLGDYSPGGHKESDTTERLNKTASWQKHG